MTLSVVPAGTAVSPPGVVAAFVAGRGLSRETLAKLGVSSATVFFPQLKRNAIALKFPYAKGDWKARAIEEKAYVASKGFKPQFWNLDAVLKSNHTTVYITEGELDACALAEAGVPHDAVVSIPTGAREKPADQPHDTRGYGYVEDALRAGLGKRVKRFVWCGDDDDPGRALRADMVRILGAARFWFVQWPEGVKDPNDLLKSDGPSTLLQYVTDGALQWPVQGLYRLAALPEPAPLTLWKPGFPEWESRVMLAPRTLSVVTGHPGHGKSILWGQIWYQVSRDYGVPVCVASFETRPKPHMRRQLRSLIFDKLESAMNDDELRRADAWINDHYLFLVHPEQRPTLEWFLDMAEVAVIRHGARVIQIDPWNRIEGTRTRDESETDYIGRCLRTMHAFAHDMGCHVQVVAHPSKMDGRRRGDPPELEDISGSKHWDNMVDQGFVVHRAQIFDGVVRHTEATLFHRKSRFDELGYACKLGLDYKLDRGRFISTDYAPATYAQRRAA